MRERDAATVFFFKHPLERHRGIPGRYAFAARGRALSRSGAEFTLSGGWRGNIYADGYANEMPGPNLDPNVFSDVLPWHLSFCRICNLRPRNLICGVPLSYRVRKGDVVVFGNLVSTHIVFVDVVFVVAATPELPKIGDEFALRDRYPELRAGVPQLEAHDWDSFAATRSYRLNLADTAAGRGHHWSNVVPYRMIVGRRWDEPADITSVELRQRFVDRAGFNCIPLAGKQASKNSAVVRRPELFCQRFEGADRLLRGGHVVELENADGERLLRTVFEAAETLVLDPIEPERPLQLADPSEAGPAAVSRE